MKNVWFVLLLTLSAAAYGQMEKTFISKDSSDINKLINIVVTGASHKYHLITIDTVHENAIEAVYSDGSHKLIFEFLHISGINANAANPVLYTFISVTGPFKDLFPFWKKYYEPDAKMNATLKASHGKIVARPYLDKQMICGFNRYGDNWEIENRYSQKKL